MGLQLPVDLSCIFVLAWLEVSFITDWEEEKFQFTCWAFLSTCWPQVCCPNMKLFLFSVSLHHFYWNVDLCLSCYLPWQGQDCRLPLEFIRSLDNCECFWRWREHWRRRNASGTVFFEILQRLSKSHDKIELYIRQDFDLSICIIYYYIFPWYCIILPVLTDVFLAFMQIWRMSDLIYRPEDEVLSELEAFKAHLASCTPRTWTMWLAVKSNSVKTE